MNYDEVITQLSKILAVEMTARTGELWRHMMQENASDVIYSENAYLVITKVWNAQRVQIRASEPEKMHAKRGGDSITCDMNRKPEAISADICNRLLPHAIEHLAQSKEYDLERRKEKNIETLRENILKKYLPKSRYHDSKFYTTTPKAGKDKNNLWAEVEYHGNIKVEVTLPIKDAIEIIKYIKEHY